MCSSIIEIGSGNTSEECSVTQPYVVLYKNSIQLVFLRKVLRQSHTDVTSFHMQFEKEGHGLLREAFQGEGECLVSQKRGKLEGIGPGKRR